jgi:hypothetical protein
LRFERAVLERTREVRDDRPLEPRFRAWLTEGSAKVLFHRDASNRIGEVLA